MWGSHVSTGTGIGIGVSCAPRTSVDVHVENLFIDLSCRLQTGWQARGHVACSGCGVVKAAADVDTKQLKLMQRLRRSADFSVQRAWHWLQ